MGATAFADSRISKKSKLWDNEKVGAENVIKIYDKMIDIRW